MWEERCAARVMFEPTWNALTPAAQRLVRDASLQLRKKNASKYLRASWNSHVETDAATALQDACAVYVCALVLAPRDVLAWEVPHRLRAAIHGIVDVAESSAWRRRALHNAIGACRGERWHTAACNVIPPWESARALFGAFDRVRVMRMVRDDDVQALASAHGVAWVAWRDGAAVMTEAIRRNRTHVASRFVSHEIRWDANLAECLVEKRNETALALLRALVVDATVMPTCEAELHTALANLGDADLVRVLLANAAQRDLTADKFPVATLHTLAATNAREDLRAQFSRDDNADVIAEMPLYVMRLFVADGVLLRERATRALLLKGAWRRAHSMAHDTKSVTWWRDVLHAYSDDGALGRGEREARDAWLAELEWHATSMPLAARIAALDAAASRSSGGGGGGDDDLAVNVRAWTTLAHTLPWYYAETRRFATLLLHRCRERAHVEPLLYGLLAGRHERDADFLEAMVQQSRGDGHSLGTLDMSMAVIQPTAWRACITLLPGVVLPYCGRVACARQYVLVCAERAWMAVAIASLAYALPMSLFAWSWVWYVFYVRVAQPRRHSYTWRTWAALVMASAFVCFLVFRATLWLEQRQRAGRWI